jgi:hypothetical protein
LEPSVCLEPFYEFPAIHSSIIHIVTHYTMTRCSKILSIAGHNTIFTARNARHAEDNRELRCAIDEP